MKRQAATESLGKVFVVLLPSVKMKSLSRRGLSFAQEFHDFLMEHFDGYTVASGNITGYWRRGGGREECNEHRQYQVAFKRNPDRVRLEKHLAGLARELGESSIYCQFENGAYLITASAKSND